MYIFLCLSVALTICESFLFPRARVPNVFLDGPFKPVPTEKSIRCEIEGTIPRVVQDSIFTRVGPNPMFEPQGGYHLFDGDGVVHWVSFNETSRGSLEATYHNRYIGTEKLKAEEEAGRALFVNIGDFCRPFAILKVMAVEMLKMVSMIPSIPRSRMSVANTNVVQHSSRTMALCESGLPYSIEYSDEGLETIGIESFGGFLKDSLTAHPKIDPVSGKMYGFGSDGSSTISMYVFGPDGAPETTFPVEMREPTLMHDFAITSNHILILDMPLIYNMDLLLQGKIPVEFNPEHSSRIGVLDREDPTGSSLRWFEVPGEPFMVSHVVNAYHESGVITLISCDMRSLSLRDVGSNISVIHRTEIDLATGSVSRIPVIGYTKKSLDFPVVNTSRTGYKNRFAYVTEFRNGIPIPGDILKVDLILEEVVGSIRMGPGECSGGCSFVSDGPGEDDGYILSFVTSGEESRMCVWKARDMKPVGTVHIPSRVPLGFHSNALPNRAKGL